jgi:hypothetical protein
MAPFFQYFCGDASGLFGEDRCVVVRSGAYVLMAVREMIRFVDPEFPENVFEKSKK